MPSDPRPLAEHRSGPALGALFGFPIGVLSGFTGVGGGEYRAPVLLALMGRIRWSIAANLFVGVIVSTTNVLYRAGWTLPMDELILVGLLIVTSLPGAYVGSAITKKLPTKALRGILVGILVVTGARLILFETRGGGDLVLNAPVASAALALGFGLGVISGLLGLAAGEYRIPALILLFGVPPVLAGTMSSLAAIPQQSVAFWTHRSLGHVRRTTYRLGLAMGGASLLGVLVGVLLIEKTTEALVAQVLGAAMIVAAAHIAWDIRHAREPEERRLGPVSSRDGAP